VLFRSKRANTSVVKVHTTVVPCLPLVSLELTVVNVIRQSNGNRSRQRRLQRSQNTTVVSPPFL